MDNVMHILFGALTPQQKQIRNKKKLIALLKEIEVLQTLLVEYINFLHACKMYDENNSLLSDSIKIDLWAHYAKNNKLVLRLQRHIAMCNTECTSYLQILSDSNDERAIVSTLIDINKTDGDAFSSLSYQLSVALHIQQPPEEIELMPFLPSVPDIEVKIVNKQQQRTHQKKKYAPIAS